MCWTLLTYNVFFCGGFTRYERGNWRLICSGLERIVFVASRDLGNGRLPPVGTDVERVFLWLFFLATSRRTPAITAVLTEPIKVGRLRCPLVDGDAVDDVGRRDAIASLSFSLSLHLRLFLLLRDPPEWRNPSLVAAAERTERIEIRGKCKKKKKVKKMK